MALTTRGLRPSDLSRLTGLSPSLLSNWLNDRNKPRKEGDLQKIATALDVSENFLWFGQPQNKQDEEVLDAAQQAGLIAPVERPQLLQPSVANQIQANSADNDFVAAKTAFQRVESYLEPWREAAENNPDIAPHVLFTLRKHLPMSDLRLFEDA